MIVKIAVTDTISNISAEDITRINPMDFDKKALSERDICTKYITPAIVQTAAWNLYTQIREEVPFTAGRVYVRGKLAQEEKVNALIIFFITNLISKLMSLKRKIITTVLVVECSKHLTMQKY